MANVPKPNIVWRGAHPNNFTIGRPGGGLDGRNTNHHVVGSAESAVLVFNQGTRQVSSHLVITDRPDVAAWQCVDFANTAFCDGNWESNLRTISMEHHGDWRFGYANPQVLENSAKVVAWLRDQGLVSRPIRHREVSRTATVCPADLPVEAIWNRATEIIRQYNMPVVDSRPQWLKDRTTANIPVTVYAQRANIYLRNLNNPIEPLDARRFVLNQSFEIGSRTIIAGKTYFITKSSTDTNAAAGLSEDDVKSVPFVPASQWVAMDTPRKMKAIKNLYVTNLDTNTNQGDVLVGGTEIDLVDKKDQNGTTYLRSRYSSGKGLNWGIDYRLLEEIVPAPVVEPPVVIPPAPKTPDWADSLLIDEANTTLYVLRATPLIDLENGRPVMKDGKEVWYAAGDIIQDVSAKTIVSGVTYELTEYSFQNIKKGNYGVANGIKAIDLTTNPKATPPGTPANPTPAPEPEDPVENMPDVPTPEATMVDKSVVILFLESLIKAISEFITKLRSTK